MKKILSTIFAVFLIFAFTAPAVAEFQDMQAAVYKWTGGYGATGPKLERITTGITFKVLAKGSNTAETLYIYGSNKYTSLTNPVTTTLFASSSYCNDYVQFRVDPTDTTDDRYVDVIVTDTNGGFTAFVEDFDKYTHTIVIDERPNVTHHGILPFGVVGTSNSAVYSGVTFLADTMVQDVRVEVVTVSTATMGVGVWGTNTGFIDGVSLTAAGYIPDAAFTTSAVSTKYGALLAQTMSGNILVRGQYVVSGTTEGTLSYTVNSVTGGAGYIHYFFTRMR